MYFGLCILPGDTSLVGRASVRHSEYLGSNPSECQILNLFRCVLSSLLPLRSVGRSNFDKGLYNLITLILKRHKIIIKLKLLCYKTESTVDSYEKKNYRYIYNTWNSSTLCIYIYIYRHNVEELHGLTYV